jgi:hypothetical protein
VGIRCVAPQHQQSKPSKDEIFAGHWWLTPKILAAWEASPVQETLIFKITGVGLAQVIEYL